MIRVDAPRLAIEPLDMRAGVDTALARVVSVFGEARAHHGCQLINRRASRVKLLLHDGFGLWLYARRLQQGHFFRASARLGTRLELTSEQLQALPGGLLRGLTNLARIRVL
jgi:transposase